MKQNNINYDAVVLGAGPYGLAVASKLQEAKLDVAVFGKPMALWINHMPKGMRLRSRWWASSLANLKDPYSIENYLTTHKIKPYDPFKIESLIDYGLWFQKNSSLNVDQKFIKRITKNETGFQVTLENGKIINAKQVVISAGVGYYVNRPEEFRKLSKNLVSHTFDNLGFSKFKGKHVVVVGGGQSALENSALMSESGIKVTIVSRRKIVWLSPPIEKTFWENLKSPKAGIADGWDNWGLEHIPYAFQLLPFSVKKWYLDGKGKHGPAGSHWLEPRLKKVKLLQGVKVTKADSKNNHVNLELSDGQKLSADHIVLATGYKVDISRLPMIDKKLLSQIKTSDGSPILSSYFESSVRGLYFTGITSQASMGPLYRFVVGTDACAKRIVTSISRAAS